MEVYSWIIGLIFLVVLIWVIVKVVNQNKKPKLVMIPNFLRRMMLPIKHYRNVVITENETDNNKR